MSGLGLMGLPSSQLEFQPSIDTRRPDGDVIFETVTDCREEDKERLRLIRKSIKKYPGQYDDRAAELVEHLLEGAERGVPRATLASRLYMRMVREKVIGNLWPFVEDDDLLPAVTATLMPTGLWVPASNLGNADPNLMMRRLASDLDRSGITGASGYLLAGLHAEFDIRREGYDFHYHLVAGGGKAKALKNLRRMPKYSAPRTEPWEQGLSERPRVRISRKHLTNLPDPLLYVIQSIFPHRPTKLHADGSVTRSKNRYRIPEPYHTELLLWLDHWSISDITLLNGLRVTCAGFELTRR